MASNCNVTPELLFTFLHSVACSDHFQCFHLQILVSIGTWWSLLNVDYYLACFSTYEVPTVFASRTLMLGYCQFCYHLLPIFRCVGGTRFAFASGKCEQ